MKNEFKPVSQFAIEAANKKRDLLMKVFFTGRMLVKEEFEHTIAGRDEDLLTYTAPELRKVGVLFIRWANKHLTTRKNDNSILVRAYYINLAAKEGFTPIAIYDANGKVEKK